ncbi:hypothetical protein [Amycolatopsis sp. cmx-4-61]|uniref:hypothetical protein n=1 Tax=Amycolatopsis sp. cmx-4-61 TaxID=2790937 RepID=UPI00397A5D5F
MERRNQIEVLFGPDCMIDCINASIATERAAAVIDASGVSRQGGTVYFTGIAQRCLAHYLLAAAILGEGAVTVVGWARADDQQPWDVLAGRPDVVPSEWAGARSEIAQLPPEQKVAVFLTLRTALAPGIAVS